MEVLWLLLNHNNIKKIFIESWFLVSPHGFLKLQGKTALTVFLAEYAKMEALFFQDMIYS